MSPLSAFFIDCKRRIGYREATIICVCLRFARIALTERCAMIGALNANTKAANNYKHRSAKRKFPAPRYFARCVARCKGAKVPGARAKHTGHLCTGACASLRPFRTPFGHGSDTVLFALRFQREARA